MGATVGSLQLNGRQVTRDNFGELTDTRIDNLSVETSLEIKRFLSEWWNNEDLISVQTSGSTGAPRAIALRKKTVAASADKTIAYFGLGVDTRVLHCLPCRYIAGKLMLVRAIRGQHDLIAVEPALNPLIGLNEHIDFAALIPAQARQALMDPETRECFKSIGQVLLGGGPIEPELEAQLAQCSNRIFHSYGMTETATHVALREVGQRKFYEALRGIEFSLDDRGCLVIKSDHLPEKVVTNDLVELIDEHTFRWLGRADHAIISGGIKHIPELVEQKISGLFEHPFIISGEPDEVLGEVIVLIVEGPVWTDEKQQTMLKKLEAVLGDYEVPRKIRFEDQFKRTQTGKIIR